MDWPSCTKYRALVSLQPHCKKSLPLIPTQLNLLTTLRMRTVPPNTVVAAMDWPNCTKYRALVSLQTHRDGVSEGEFNDVLAYASIEEDYMPRVTFIVVPKGHHTRLFPNDHVDYPRTTRSGNILPGGLLWILEFVTRQNSISTPAVTPESRPTPYHVHVLYDENKFSADALQMLLTNSLTYTYARCTWSVSIFRSEGDA
ncbi:protein argonaute MEL1-like [Rutidosis leptorrhynchoides]|uniref:protein argonaute MEL1-like n=1 Tax=Rutidosis leptorrhynchoides TaxID=125765 RepID=UPI003A995941